MSAYPQALEQLGRGSDELAAHGARRRRSVVA
jgi:hypothetical protein